MKGACAAACVAWGLMNSIGRGGVQMIVIPTIPETKRTRRKRGKHYSQKLS